MAKVTYYFAERPADFARLRQKMADTFTGSPASTLLFVAGLASAEKRALLLMLIAIALWATDLIHHISPAIIGIGVGLLAVVPGVGVLNQDDLKRFNYLRCFSRLPPSAWARFCSRRMRSTR